MKTLSTSLFGLRFEAGYTVMHPGVEVSLHSPRPTHYLHRYPFSCTLHICYSYKGWRDVTGSLHCQAIYLKDVISKAPSCNADQITGTSWQLQSNYSHLV
jgi:hypothetical protein